MIALRIQTVDAIIVKEIQWGEVKTQTFSGAKTHIERKDIKRLGYKSEDELVEALKASGYEEVNSSY